VTVFVDVVEVLTPDITLEAGLDSGAEGGLDGSELRDRLE